MAFEANNFFRSMTSFVTSVVGEKMPVGEVCTLDGLFVALQAQGHDLGAPIQVPGPHPQGAVGDDEVVAWHKDAEI